MYKELNNIVYYTREELEEKYEKLYKDYKLLDIQSDNREYDLNLKIEELQDNLPLNTTLQIVELIKQSGLYTPELDTLFNEYVRYELKEERIII